MELKREFVCLALQDGANRRELCARYGISRTLGYRLLRRYAEEGEAGLVERSRRPVGSPRATAAGIEAEVLAVRTAHPSWGGRKIAAVLRARGIPAPSPSTVTQILRRHGVALGVSGVATAATRFEHAAPNDLWQMDFKGHVALRQGRLHPLTVLDDHSRFAVVLAACADERTATVKAHLTEAFRRYGLPWRITSDNGPPWGNGPGEPFTPLGVWLLEQDIRIGHSRPYHPQTQGKDERFHRTLKAEALQGPPFADLNEASRRLEAWRAVYNTERPHQAIGLVPPIRRFAHSPRPFKEIVQPFDYGPDDTLRHVQAGGWLHFKGRTVRMPRAFRGKAVAIRPTPQDGRYDVVFRTTRIGAVDLTAPKEQA